LIQIAITGAVALAVILVIRWLLGRGRAARLLDVTARRMVLRSLTLLVVIGGVLAVVASNNHEVERQLTDGVLSYLPQAVAGSLILLTAVILARLVSVLVSEVMRARTPILANRIGKLLWGTILLIGSVLAADQFGITTDLILLIIGAGLAAVAIGSALAFGLGAVPVARQIAAGRHIDSRYSIGDELRIGDVQGVLTVIGIASSRIESPTGTWEVPNEDFLAGPVQIIEVASSDD
jgi:uncharacterized membrane protein YdcZ (DUF606 family)